MVLGPEFAELRERAPGESDAAAKLSKKCAILSEDAAKIHKLVHKLNGAVL